MEILSWSGNKDVGRVAILLVTVLGLAIGDNPDAEPLCGSNQCAKFDKDLSYLWDGSHNMCERPYSTVCSHNVFQPATANQWVDDKWDHYKAAEYAFHEREKEVLAKPGRNAGLDRANKFFLACVDTKNDYYSVVFDEAKKIIDQNPVGPWRLVQQNGSPFKPQPTDPWWRELDKYYLEKTGESILHHFSNAVSYADKKNILIMKPPESLIPKQILLDIENADAECKTSHEVPGGPRKYYANYILNILTRFYTNIPYKYWWSEDTCEIVDKMIQFEIELAKISFAENEIRFSLPLRNPPNFAEWKQWYENQLMYHDYSLDKGVKWIESPILQFARSLELKPDPLTINWEKWVADLWQTIIKSGKQITDRSIHTALVEVPNKTYYLKLAILLRKSNPEVVANFMHWKFLRNSLIRTKTGAAEFQALAEHMGFKKKLNKPSWLRCVEENALKDVVHGEVMHQERQLAEKKSTIRTIYDGVVMSLIDRQILQNLYRANSDEILENHVNEMTINIFGDDTLLKADQSGDLPDRPSVSNYFTEYLSQQKWRVKHVLSKLGTDSNGKIWPVSPDRAGVFVTTSPHSHQLFVPAAILQKPFFDLQQDKFRNYAGIGAEIATAIWHSAIFPATFPEETYQWAKNCFHLKENFNPDLITESTERRIFKSGKQTVDGVQMALDAFSQEGRYEDDNGLGYALQNSEKQAFVAAYISTQCEYVNSYAPSARWAHSISGAKPALDTIGLRGIGVHYSFKDDSTSKFRIAAIKHSWFFNDIFLCPKIVSSEHC